MEEQYIFFWSTESPLSNWHPAYFELEGIKFNCSEQYMMYKKALLFEDFEIAEKVLQAETPEKQKALGRQVKCFNFKIWEKHCKTIVYDGCRAKFTQNENLLRYLLKTVGKTLVEASPVDQIWGIGLAANDRRALDRNKWKGKNWLGEVLTKLRDDFINEGFKD